MSVMGQRRGFVLAAVLWLLVAVGAASASFQITARTNRAGAINVGADVRARWAAREGLARVLDAVERLGMGRGEWDRAGLGRAITLAPLPGDVGTEITVRIDDARSRLDLNHATPLELGSLLGVLLKASDPPPLQLRDRILDWRDPDQRRRQFGAENTDYRDLDRPGRAGDGPFESVAELNEVLGVDGDLVDRLAPFFTVGGDGPVNVNSASPQVLSAVMGIDPGDAEVVARRARSRPFSSLFEILRVLPAGAAQELQPRVLALQDRLVFGPRDLEVHVVATVPGSGVVARIDASIRLVRSGLWQFRSVLES